MGPANCLLFLILRALSIIKKSLLFNNIRLFSNSFYMYMSGIRKNKLKRAITGQTPSAFLGGGGGGIC